MSTERSEAHYTLEIAALKERIADLEASEVEHARVVSELKKRDLDYRTLVDNLPQRIFLKDKNSVYVSCNHIHARDLGITPEEIVDKTDYDFYPPEVAEEYRSNDQRVMERGEKDDFEEKYIQGERELWVHTVKIPLKDDAGNVIGILGYFQDITEQVRAKEALNRSREEAAHSQRLLLSLSQVTQAVQGLQTPEEIYHIVGEEVTNLGYHTVFFSLSTDKKHLNIPYLTIDSALLRMAEKLAGVSARDFQIPIKFRGFYDRVIREARAFYLPHINEPLAETLPKATRAMAGRILKLLKLKDAIYAPLKTVKETYGILLILGDGLSETDIPAVNILANQVAIALENVLLILEARAWADELEQHVEDRTAELRVSEQELLERTEDLILINEVNDALNQGKNLDEVIKLISSKTKEMYSAAGVAGASIFLVSEDQKSLVMQNLPVRPKTVQKLEALIGRALPRFVIPIKDGSMHKKVIEAGRPLLLNEPKEINRWVGEFATETWLSSQRLRRQIRRIVPQVRKLLGIESMIIIPLYSDSNPIGLMEISSDTPFSEVDLSRLELIGRQLTEAIQHTQAEEALRTSEERYHTIFETAAIPIWEEDFSAVKIAIDDIKAQGVTDFREYLNQHPEFVIKTASLIKVLDVNQATLKMYKAASKEELLGSLDLVLVPESMEAFQGELIAIAEGKTFYEGEIVNYTLQGERLIIWLTITFPTEKEAFNSVLVSMIDINKRVQAEKEIQQRMLELSMLSNVSQKLARASLKSDEIAMIVTRQFVEVIGSPECSVSLYDSKDGTLRTLVDYYIEEGEHVDSEWVGKVISLADYPATVQVLKTMEPLVVQASDSNADPAELAFMREHEVTTLAIFPMAVKGRAIGIIELEGWEEEYHYTPQEMDLAMTLANQAAVALENARLYETAQREISERARAEEAIRRQLKEQSVLQAVATSGTESINEDALIKRTTQIISDTLYPDHFGVLLLDENQSVLRLHPSYKGVSEETKQLIISVNQGVTGRVVATGQTLRISDVSAEGNYLELTPGTRAELCVPLKIGERVIGVINAESATPGIFSETDERLMITLAGQLATAIDRLRSEAAERDQRALAEALRDTAATLNSTLDIDEILDRILDNVERVVPYDTISISLVENGVARFVRQRGFEERGLKDWVLGLRINISEFPDLERVFMTREAVLTVDTRANPNWITIPETSWIRSNLTVPISRDDEMLGNLNLDSETPGFFTEEHARNLQALADQVSVALENARLYQGALKAAERQATLHQLSQEIVAASRDPKKVYQAVHQATEKLMPCEAFTITLMIEEEGLVDIVYVYDKGKLYPAHQRSLKGSLSDHVIISGQSLLVDDVENHPEMGGIHFGNEQHVRSVLAVPMKLNGKSMGMLSTQSYWPNAYSQTDQHLLETLAANAAVALENARLFDATQAHARHLESLNDLTRSALATEDLSATLKTLANHMARILHADSCLITLWDADRQRPIPAAAEGPGKDVFFRLQVEPGETTMTAAVLKAGHPLVAEDVFNSPLISPRITAMFTAQSMLGLPLIADGRKLGAALITFEQPHQFTTGEITRGEHAAGQVSLALAKMQLLDEIHRRAEELTAVADVSAALRTTSTRAEMPAVILNQLRALLGAQGAMLAIPDPISGETMIELATGGWEQATGLRLSPGIGFAGYVIESGETYINNDVRSDPHFCGHDEIGSANVLACVPLIAQEQVIGALCVGREETESQTPPPFTETEIRLLTAIADMAANGLHRATLHEQTEQRLERLTALHEIDMAISASVDLSLPFNILLDKVITHLEVDASAILKFNSVLQQLEHVASRGFRTDGITRTQLRLGEDYAGRAALERRIISVSDLNNAAKFTRAHLVKDEKFVSYFAVPLVAKGQIEGVLEIFHRSPMRPDPEWIDFLNTLATQAAIAIDSSSMFIEVQRSNLELVMSYDETIEGWAHALELRDMETEGHSQRVTEMTIRLARTTGIKEDDLVHVRRGALLHDIGKMGIPDHILHKGGEFTADEWEIMRNHPVYAHQLLSPIDYLRPALDIPYCHHEKWDGTGYPRGLKGIQIPMAARVFAVVDVWDALLSDRPYRKAWPEEDTLNYIRSQSGEHFDPQVVEQFFELLP